MGLPMFKEPEEDSNETILKKVDRAAASHRSRIRRERTVRETQPRRLSAERGEREERQAFDNAGVTGRPRVRVQQGPGRERILEGSRSRDGRRWSTIVDGARSVDEDSVENLRRRQAGEELFRDALQYQRPGQRMRVPRSPDISALRFEFEPRARLARPYMPSPPHSFSENSTTGVRTTGPSGRLDVHSAEPTPGFAPAQGVHRDNQEREPLARGSSPRHYTPPGESSWTASYPPLRRVAHSSPRPESNLSRYGGLGDRHRSFSSSSSEGGHDTWETLLTTMEPDTQLPSAESSFTSATASQSTRQSRRSSRTRNSTYASVAATIPPTVRHRSRSASPTSSYPTLLEAGEVSLEIQSPQYDCLSPESRASMRTMLSFIQNARQHRASTPFAGGAELRRRADENLIMANHFNTLRIMDNVSTIADAQAHLRQPTGIGPPTSHELGLETPQLSQASSTTLPPRHAAAYLLEIAAAAAGNGADDDVLRILQRVITRMARRDDLSDEWWAEAGLVRTRITEGVRTQDQNQD